MLLPLCFLFLLTAQSLHSEEVVKSKQIYKHIVEVKSGESNQENDLPRSCLELLQSGDNQSGVYRLKTDGGVLRV